MGNSKKPLTKQEKMNIKRRENLQEVRATITFECGACGFVSVMDVTPDVRGLIFIPEAYCGRCSKNLNFRPISYRVTKIEVKTVKEWAEIDEKLLAKCLDEIEEQKNEITGGAEQTETGESTEETKQEDKGEVDKE